MVWSPGGVLQGVVGVDPMCIVGRICKGQTGINPGCSKMKQLGQDSVGEVRKDKIRERDHSENKKSASARETVPPGLAIHRGKWW